MKKVFNTSITTAAAGLLLFALAGCASFGTVIAKHEVKEIPDLPYERIIRLYNPEGVPDKTLAGVVFIKKGAKVCTDFPREIIIKSLDELDPVEKQTYTSFSKYVIKSSEEIFGYAAIAHDYRVNFWENLKDENCHYKVQIVIPEPAVRGTTGAGVGIGAGGHGGGI
ncbi:MAG: hypothetical protein JW914_04775 [Syntrophaceae bacterium]|nr:hypothetical protein [Syntrophaceae bacterium]